MADAIGSIPELIGPIETGASFMIVSIQNNVPFILNSIAIQNGISYYWESNVQNTLSSFGIFTSQGSLDSLTIKDTINGGGIAFTNNIVTNSLIPSNLTMSQPLFANWFPPDIFLSSVIYTMYNNGVTGQIYETKELKTTIPANNLIILPVLWYFNCTSSGAYDVINQPDNSVINWFCLVGATGCSNIDIAPSGWTNLSDCTIGNKYQYCSTNNLCGSNSCNGPCSVIYDDCTFSSNTYTCVFDPNKFVNDTEWWESPYFIGLIIVIIIIIILITVFIIY